MIKQTDISTLLERVEKLQVAADVARGTSSQLITAAPLEIHFYNIATHLKSELGEFRALLKDADGTYLKEVERRV